MSSLNLDNIQRHPASFRDPCGTVFDHNGCIIRGLSATGVKLYQEVRASSFLDRLESENRIIKTTDIHMDNSKLDYLQFIQHATIPFISYPYEWPFLLLKDAALFHLNLQMDGLETDFILRDASAYNVQFQGIVPIFIDVLSFKKYQPGELWKGHRQFCEQFLNPLLMFALKGIPYHAWYRGALDGIPIEFIASLLPKHSWLSMRALTHILLPANKKIKTTTIKKIQKASLPKAAYLSLLQQLYNWIEDLQPQTKQLSLWENYANNPPYSNQESQAKSRFIAEFSAKTKAKFLMDLGCNTGEFAEVALANGVAMVIGFDSDTRALNRAVIRAKQKNLNFLPLYQEMTNPSPAQGWLLGERSTMASRGRPDALLALAFIHHVVIAHNILLSEAVHWLVSLAPVGVIEFIPKSDATVQQMLALREDIFSEYSQEIFVRLLQEKAVIIQSDVISQSGRCLYWYEVKNDGN